MSSDEDAGKPIDWYRSPLSRELMKLLNTRSNALAMLQTGGYMAILLVTASLAWYSAYHWSLWLTIPLIFAHGTCYAFQMNAVHELGHKSVFRSRGLNSLFEHLFAFLGWINHRMFWTSHLRHHRYTLHPPDDLEVVLPIKLTRADFLRSAIVNPLGFWWSLKYTWQIAMGHFSGEWVLKLYSAEPADHQKRREAIAWARTILLGHLLIVAVAVWSHWWMLLVLVTFAPFYGGALQFLCNNTQHTGLRDNVPDYRLCCRTIRLNPLVRFLYWQMNYHTEHHMYPGVPCYRLGQLHRAIVSDLPPTKGLIGAWREIAEIQAKQRVDPDYRYEAPLPAQSDSVTARQAAG